VSDYNRLKLQNEEFWNVITHFIGLIFFIIGTPLLFYYNNNLSDYSIIAISLFSFGLLFVYLSSTVYHYVTNIKLKEKLRTIDHISIFYLILGSYAPVCLITLYDYSGNTIFINVLILAIIGTLFKAFYIGKYENISLGFYLLMGWLIIVDIKTLFDLIEFKAKILLVASGLSYTLGTYFYASNRIKYSHTIWHLFVLAGSLLHFFMVLFFII